MKQAIKAATVFHCTLPSIDALTEHLAEKPMQEIKPTERVRMGWVPNPTANDLVNQVDKPESWIGMTLQIDEKEIPKSLLIKRCAQMASENDQVLEELNKTELDELKIKAFDELCSKALPKTRMVHGFYHYPSKIMIVGSTTDSNVDCFMSTLLHCVGSITSQTIHISGIKDGLTQRLKDSIKGKQAFGDLKPNGKGVLVRKEKIDNKTQTEKITFSETDLTSREVEELLYDGFDVEQLGFDNDQFYFVLDEKFKIRSISDYSYEAPDLEAEDIENDQLFLWNRRQLSCLFQINKAVEVLCEMFNEQRNNQPIGAE